MRRISTVSLLLVGALSAFGQGTPGVLRCTFQGSLDVHATREPSSPIIAKVKCGDPILIIEQRFGSPHVRGEDGKDGYIIGLNLGQWTIEPESSSSPTPANVLAAPPRPTPPSVQQQATAQPQQNAAAIVDGTPIRIRINQTISSADAKVGQTVDFEVLDEVKVGDTVVIQKGGLALATVTEAQSKRRMGRGGKLDINIDHAKLVTGEKLPLRAVKENQGGGHVGAMTGAMVATTIVFFPAAPLFLFMHGKDITIPKGTEVTAFVNGDYPIDLAKFRTPAGQPPAAVAEAIVTINSNPDGADITVDGKYLGNTPSTVRLGSGDHAVKIEKVGFRSWERSVSVTSGSTLNLSPSLEKNQ